MRSDTLPIVALNLQYGLFDGDPDVLSVSSETYSAITSKVPDSEEFCVIFESCDTEVPINRAYRLKSDTTCLDNNLGNISSQICRGISRIHGSLHLISFGSLPLLDRVRLDFGHGSESTDASAKVVQFLDFAYKSKTILCPKQVWSGYNLRISQCWPVQFGQIYEGTTIEITHSSLLITRAVNDYLPEFGSKSMIELEVCKAKPFVLYDALMKHQNAAFLSVFDMASLGLISESFIEIANEDRTFVRKAICRLDPFQPTSGEILFGSGFDNHCGKVFVYKCAVSDISIARKVSLRIHKQHEKYKDEILCFLNECKRIIRPKESIWMNSSISLEILQVECDEVVSPDYVILPNITRLEILAANRPIYQAITASESQRIPLTNSYHNLLELITFKSANNGLCLLIKGDHGSGKIKTVQKLCHDQNIIYIDAKPSFDQTSQTQVLEKYYDEACQCISDGQKASAIVIRNIDCYWKSDTILNFMVSHFTTNSNKKEALNCDASSGVILIMTSAKSLCDPHIESFSHAILENHGTLPEFEREVFLKNIFERLNQHSAEIDWNRVLRLTKTLPWPVLLDMERYIWSCIGNGIAPATIDTATVLKAIKYASNQLSSNIGQAKIPEVEWSDVGGLEHVKIELTKLIELPLSQPEFFDQLKSGILLYGPPGTGKTLIAKAVATNFQLSFISVKGPELLNMYIGESEANVRQIFERARQNQPCIIFFDEIDSIAPKRGRNGDSSGVMDRITSQLFTEMDKRADLSDKDSMKGIFVIAATNRPDLLDSALLRPGRFDQVVYLGIPETKEQQKKIISALVRKFPLEKQINLDQLVNTISPIYTSADYYSLASSVYLKALKRACALDKTTTEKSIIITQNDFDQCIAKMTPSVSQSELEYYNNLKTRLEPTSRSLLQPL